MHQTSPGPSVTETSGTRTTTWGPGTVSLTWRRGTLGVDMLTVLVLLLVMVAR